MKILVTGNQGYIGSVLVPIILSSGHEVVGYDIGYFKDCLFEPIKTNFQQIQKDIRKINRLDLQGIEAIIHLAALSNDPLGELVPGLTEEINYSSTIKTAKLAKEMGVKRFIYSSSQSMYGVSNTDDELDEYSSVKNPVTAYAKTKWDAECELNKLNDENFTVVSFRPSTVFGASPRLRSDIVFNNLVGCAFTTGKLEIKSDGTPWRPVVHVKDVSAAFIAGLNAPKELVSGRSYNVGIPNGNFRVREIAEAAQSAVKNSKLVFTGEHSNDSRTYRVSFKRILTELTDYYKPKWNLKSGGDELVKFFKKINFNENDFRGIKSIRIEKLKDLEEKKIINSNMERI